MRSEEEIRTRLANNHKELEEVRKKWHDALYRELDGTLPHHRSINEDPTFLSATITQLESELFILRWVLGGDEEECLREAGVI